MCDDDEPAATLKKGGGRGRGGGFGYVFKQQFAKLFEKALKITMKSYSPPANLVFDAALTTQILTMLKTTFSELSKPVYDKMQDREDPKKMTWNGVSDTIRRFVFGIYDRDKIPVYMVHAVQEIDDPKWNSFFTQRIIVKHNHRSVQRCIETHRAHHSSPPLLDLNGVVIPSDRPQQPKPPDFFDTITVLRQDIPEQPLPPPAPVAEAPDAAPPEVPAPAAPQAVAPLNVHEQDRRARVQARRAAEAAVAEAAKKKTASKRKAPDVIPESSRPKTRQEDHQAAQLR